MTILYHLFRFGWRNTRLPFIPPKKNPKKRTFPRATSDSLIKQLGIEHPETRDLDSLDFVGLPEIPRINAARQSRAGFGNCNLAVSASVMLEILQRQIVKLSMYVLKKQALTKS